jgi:hypothetical protein
MKTRPRLLPWLLALTTAGCSTMATINTRDGRVFEGRINSSDGRAVYIGPSNAPVARSEIVEIDHPGNGVLITGVSLTAYGILNAAYVFGQAEYYEDPDAARVISLTPAVVGLGLAIWGSTVYVRSTNAARGPTPPAKVPPAKAQPAFTLVPVLAPGQAGPMVGGAFAARF